MQAFQEFSKKLLRYVDGCDIWSFFVSSLAVWPVIFSSYLNDLLLLIAPVKSIILFKDGLSV